MMRKRAAANAAAARADIAATMAKAKTSVKKTRGATP